MFGDLDPANCFAMESLNMAFTAELTCDGKPLPKLLFIDIMTDKTEMLINHLKHLQLGLSLVQTLARMWQLWKYMTIML